MRTRLLLFLLVLPCLVIPGASTLVDAQTKYGVSVKTSKPAALAKARTYAWRSTRPSFDKNVDGLIVAAIDRELSARGLTKLESGPSNIVVTYASISRTDVNGKGAPTTGTANQFDVGTLSVDMTDPANRQVLFSVRADARLPADRTQLETTVNDTVAAMFQKYPSVPRP